MKFCIGACLFAVTLAGSANGLDAKVDRFMHKPKRPVHHRRTPEQMEKEVEDMARRVRRLGDGQVAKRLSKEVDMARGSLCLQQGFKKHERVPCENFMRQACGSFLAHGAGKRSTKTLPASYCMEFFQEKQPPSIAEVGGDLGKAYTHVVNNVDDALQRVGDSITGTRKADTESWPPEASTQAVREQREEKEEKMRTEAGSSEPGCADATWKSKSGSDCSDYATGNWCTRRGTPGDGWLTEWGDFEDQEAGGMTAADACCACGGGVRTLEALAEAGPAPAPGMAAAPSPDVPMGLKAPTEPFHELGMELRPLQSQGVSGQLTPVHEDGQTMISDWQREFGPKQAGTRDVKEICAKYPDNEWCRLNGYYPKEKSSRSGATHVAGMSATLLLAVLAVSF